VISAGSGLVLAGGKSSRMGTPKAWLRFDGEPLLGHVVRALGRLFDDVVVVAAPGQELPPTPAAVVRDDVAHQGPVGGLCYGLRSTRGEFSFVTSCDVAFLNPELIAHLVSRIADHDVVVPHWEGRLQPLHAVYRRSVLPLLEDQLARGELRPVQLFGRVRTCTVHEEAVRRLDPEGLSFLNMNTPADYEEASRRWAGRAAPQITCTVELLGVARLVAGTRAVSLSLPARATLSQVYAALGARLPTLVGRVIDRERNDLSPGYACNLNGLDFVRATTTAVGPGDTIVILSADAGG